MKRSADRPAHPLLSDPQAFRRAVIRTVATSTAVETGEHIETLERALRRRDSGIRSNTARTKR
jgi:hypothetical protein